jgi:hypothetical protein
MRDLENGAQWFVEKTIIPWPTMIKEASKVKQQASSLPQPSTSSEDCKEVIQ